VQAPEPVSIGAQSWRDARLRQRAENATGRGSIERVGKLADRVRTCVPPRTTAVRR